MKQVALFAAIFGLSIVATAQTPAPPPAEAASEQAVAAPVASVQDEERVKATNLSKRSDGNCLTRTGSRVVRDEGTGRKCANAPGRVYSREEIVRTGRIDLADALRALDPAIH